jgi:hypothetical protein
MRLDVTATQKETTMRNRVSRFFALVLVLGVSPLCAQAQTLNEQQVLTAPARGEGGPERYFGSDVAIDGDLAVVREAFLGARVRGYRRINGSWERALELDLQDPTHSPQAMAVNEGRLIITVAVGSSRLVRILRATPTGWVEEYASSIDRPEFGDSVAIDGSIAVIGDSNAGGGGALYVTRRGAQNVWSATDALTPTPRQSGAAFGQEIAIVASAVVAAAPREDVNGASDAGAAYIFELTQSTWTQVSRLTAPTVVAGERFGSAVAISGLNEAIPDRLLVGSRGATGLGRVYAVRRQSGVWEQSFIIEPPVAEANSSFGSQLSMDGDVALIAAPLLDGNGGNETGAVWGVDFNANLSSATLTRRNDPLNEPNVRLGNGVAIDRNGPTALIGAPRSAANGNLSGSVLMSVGTSGQPFPPLQRVFALGRNQDYARFGAALHSDGDTLIVGAPQEAPTADDGTGAVYFYGRTANGPWQLTQRLQSPQGQAGDRYGEAVAVHGDFALVGAPGVDLVGTDAGVVYVYRRSNGIWNIDRQLTTPCPNPQRREFGRRIVFDGMRAMIGAICPPPGGGIDIGIYIATRQTNGEWTFDLVETALRLGSGAWDAGLAVFGVYAVQGGPDAIFSGFVHTYAYDGSDWQLVGLLDNGNDTPTPQGYGFDVGVDQGLLAAASYRGGTAIAVRRRVGDQFLPETSLLPTGLAAGEPLWAVAVKGERIAVGAPQHAVSVANQGAVFLFERQLGSWQQTQRLLSSTPAALGAFGTELVYGSDGALLVGAPGASLRFRNEGAVHVFAAPSNEVFRDGFE